MYLVFSPHDIASAVFGLSLDGVLRNEEEVKSSPEELLACLYAFLFRHDLTLSDLRGILIITGPGSFTSLRAGTAIVNTLGFTHSLPLFPIENPDHLPLRTLIQGMDLSHGNEVVIPNYGRDPTITSPRAA